MSALFAICRRAAPILLEEHPQSLFGRGKIGFGIERAERRIGGDSFVEPFDERNEGGLTADGVVEGL
jgi:hypothetical protein